MPLSSRTMEAYRPAPLSEGQTVLIITQITNAFVP
jgi:hypothetical protein